MIVWRHGPRTAPSAPSATSRFASTRGEEDLLALELTVVTDELAVIRVGGRDSSNEVISRASIAPRLAQLVRQSQVPVRAVIREIDGTVYTQRFQADPAAASVVEPIESAPTPAAMPVDASVTTGGFFTVSAGGFIPGEDVLVAVVLRATSGAPDGSARALIDPAEASGPHEVILCGSVSGTVATGSALA